MAAAAHRNTARALQTTCRRCLSSSSPSTSTPVAESSSAARLRFAPSPTGFLHLGGLRTALFNHLLARKWKGKWVLRIEDTDQARLVQGAVDGLRRTLEWAGLNYDEGVGAGGSHGPYTQSERLDIYRHYVQQLLEHDHAYECFCTPDELQQIRLSMMAKGHKYPYDGRCRHLTREDVKRRKQAGNKHVVRFKTHKRSEPIPDDLIFGRVTPQQGSEMDDFIVLKSDGWPTYHLASVVDDHLMEISHVLRGEEWLPSLPKHHELYGAFGWKPPLFGHLPLLINADGTKLSKRTGDVAVEAYRKNGYEPEALLNFLALMGWDHHTALAALAEAPEGLPPHTRSDAHSLYEVFTVPQLVRAFDLSHINHKKAAVNLSKLDFLNKMTLRRKAGRLGQDGLLVNAGKEADDEGSHLERHELVVRLQDILKQHKLYADSDLVNNLDYLEKVLDAELPRIVKLNDIILSSVFFFHDPQYDHPEAVGMVSSVKVDGYVEGVDAVRHALEERSSREPLTEDEAWAIINDVLARLRPRSRQLLLTPLRHALTGRKKGPSVPVVMSVLGLDRTLARLSAGTDFVKSL